MVTFSLIIDFLYQKSMKIIFIILFLIGFGSTSSFAQTYFPFPDSVGIWRETSIFYQQNSNGITFKNIFINGDTIINGDSYNKLYIYSCGQYIISDTYPIPAFDCPIDTSTSIYYGALREVNKRIYFYPDSNFGYYNFCSNSIFNGDFLLFDFNSTIGDTVYYMPFDSSYMVINSIDSILIQGQYRKKYNYSFQSALPDCWGSSNYVEGIGDIYAGLFSHITSYFENGEFLNCFEDNQVTFSNNGGCVTNSLNEFVNENDLKIYPNPTSNKLYVELEHPTRTKVSLFDISGKEVYSSFINQSKSIIDVSSFKSGLYLVKVVNENGSSKSKLINIY
ncbi:MAG: hypothetical protein A3K10_02210 [Bacteroidetes bacterium RIFCSPLOWO2_12_FULL_31_6]|nr:MAG: hypothetical protein A3K10_02210 [Bacteroidetes bacterium RIFCSPLOWO2_12_FULL_31_6]